MDGAHIPEEPNPEWFYMPGNKLHELNKIYGLHPDTPLDFHLKKPDVSEPAPEAPVPEVPASAPAEPPAAAPTAAAEAAAPVPAPVEPPVVVPAAEVHAPVEALPVAEAKNEAKTFVERLKGLKNEPWMGKKGLAVAAGVVTLGAVAYGAKQMFGDKKEVAAERG